MSFTVRLIADGGGDELSFDGIDHSLSLSEFADFFQHRLITRAAERAGRRALPLATNASGGDAVTLFSADGARRIGIGDALRRRPYMTVGDMLLRLAAGGIGRPSLWAVVAGEGGYTSSSSSHEAFPISVSVDCCLPVPPRVDHRGAIVGSGGTTAGRLVLSFGLTAAGSSSSTHIGHSFGYSSGHLSIYASVGDLRAAVLERLAEMRSEASRRGGAVPPPFDLPSCAGDLVMSMGSTSARGASLVSPPEGATLLSCLMTAAAHNISHANWHGASIPSLSLTATVCAGVTVNVRVVPPAATHETTGASLGHATRYVSKVLPRPTHRVLSLPKVPRSATVGDVKQRLMAVFGPEALVFAEKSAFFGGFAGGGDGGMGSGLAMGGLNASTAAAAQRPHSHHQRSANVSVYEAHQRRTDSEFGGLRLFMDPAAAATGRGGAANSSSGTSFLAASSNTSAFMSAMYSPAQCWVLVDSMTIGDVLAEVVGSSTAGAAAGAAYSNGPDGPQLFLANAAAAEDVIRRTVPAANKAGSASFALSSAHEAHHHQSYQTPHPSMSFVSKRIAAAVASPRTRRAMIHDEADAQAEIRSPHRRRQQQQSALHHNHSRVGGGEHSHIDPFDGRGGNANGQPAAMYDDDSRRYIYAASSAHRNGGSHHHALDRSAPPRIRHHRVQFIEAEEEEEEGTPYRGRHMPPQPHPHPNPYFNTSSAVPQSINASSVRRPSATIGLLSSFVTADDGDDSGAAAAGYKDHEPSQRNQQQHRSRDHFHSSHADAERTRRTAEGQQRNDLLAQEEMSHVDTAAHFHRTTSAASSVSGTSLSDAAASGPRKSSSSAICTAPPAMNRRHTLSSDPHHSKKGAGGFIPPLNQAEASSSEAVGQEEAAADDWQEQTEYSPPAHTLYGSASSAASGHHARHSSNAQPPHHPYLTHEHQQHRQRHHQQHSSVGYPAQNEQPTRRPSPLAGTARSSPSALAASSATRDPSSARYSLSSQRPHSVSLPAAQPLSVTARVTLEKCRVRATSTHRSGSGAASVLAAASGAEVEAAMSAVRRDFAGGQQNHHHQQQQQIPLVAVVSSEVVDIRLPTDGDAYTVGELKDFIVGNVLVPDLLAEGGGEEGAFGGFGSEEALFDALRRRVVLRCGGRLLLSDAETLEGLLSFAEGDSTEVSLPLGCRFLSI